MHSGTKTSVGLPIYKLNWLKLIDGFKDNGTAVTTDPQRRKMIEMLSQIWFDLLLFK